MTQQLSDKLRVMSAVSIVIVLYIHAAYYNGFFTDEAEGELAVTGCLQSLLGYEVGRCAVPLFFAMSGYLFFRGIDLAAPWRRCYATLWLKMVRRVRTLVVPYLIAAWIPPLVFFAMEHVPGGKAYYDYTFFTDTFAGPLPRLLRMVYWDSASGVPFAFQLWFLRDLIIIVALSPLLLLAARLLNRHRGGYSYLAALLFLLTFAPLPSPLPTTGAMWFVAGRAWLDRLSTVRSWVVPVAFAVLCLTEMNIVWDGWRHVQLPIIALGVWTLWVVYDYVVPTTFVAADHRLLQAVCRCTFFVYLVHIPLLKFVTKAVLVVCGRSDGAFATAYLAAPWLFLLGSVPAAWLLRRYVPRLYGVVTGGR